MNQTTKAHLPLRGELKTKVLPAPLTPEHFRRDEGMNAAVGGVVASEQLFLGSSHSNHYLVTAADGREFIAKQIYDFALAGCNRPATYEFRALLLASKMKLAPEPIYLDRELNIVVMERVRHVPYDHLSLDALRVRALLGMRIASLVPLAGEFRLLHGVFKIDINSHSALIMEALTVASSMTREGAEIQDLADRVLRMCLPCQPILATLPKVFSHNDLVSSNVLTALDGSVLAIDFETAGLNGLDFVIGQIAVDADIDWMLNGRAELDIGDLVVWLTEVTGVVLPHELLWARVAERLLQNTAYAFRQIGVVCEPLTDSAYLERKQQVLSHCRDRLDKVLTQYG